MERRLAAILAADVVGYSRLIGADEEGTLQTLRAYGGWGYTFAMSLIPSLPNIEYRENAGGKQ